jgi:hypothetical protein
MTSIAKSIPFSTNFSDEICEFSCGRRNGCFRTQALRARFVSRRAAGPYPSFDDSLGPQLTPKTRKL